MDVRKYVPIYGGYIFIVISCSVVIMCLRTMIKPYQGFLPLKCNVRFLFDKRTDCAMWTLWFQPPSEGALSVSSGILGRLHKLKNGSSVSFVAICIVYTP